MDTGGVQGLVCVSVQYRAIQHHRHSPGTHRRAARPDAGWRATYEGSSRYVREGASRQVGEHNIKRSYTMLPPNLERRRPRRVQVGQRDTIPYTLPYATMPCGTTYCTSYNTKYNMVCDLQRRRPGRVQVGQRPARARVAVLRRTALHPHLRCVFPWSYSYGKVRVVFACWCLTRVAVLSSGAPPALAVCIFLAVFVW